MAIGANGQHRVVAAIEARRDFRQASMTGRHFDTGRDAYFAGTGKLPSEHVEALRSTEGPVFVVYSYSTPIAWFAGEWTAPAVHYSPTTNAHQSLARRALPELVAA